MGDMTDNIFLNRKGGASYHYQRIMYERRRAKLSDVSARTSLLVSPSVIANYPIHDASTPGVVHFGQAIDHTACVDQFMRISRSGATVLKLRPCRRCFKRLVDMGWQTWDGGF